MTALSRKHRIEQDPRWQAVLKRDASADASFVYAVRTTGVVGRALRFDGSDDRVSATSATSLNVTSAFTVACWVKPESASDSRYIVIKGDSSDKKYAYGLRTSSGKLQYRWISPSGTESVFQTTSTVLTNGRWTHVAVAHMPGSVPYRIKSKRETSEYSSKVKGSRRMAVTTRP